MWIWLLLGAQFLPPSIGEPSDPDAYLIGAPVCVDDARLLGLAPQGPRPDAFVSWPRPVRTLPEGSPWWVDSYVLGNAAAWNGTEALLTLLRAANRLQSKERRYGSGSNEECYFPLYRIPSDLSCVDGLDLKGETVTARAKDLAHRSRGGEFDAKTFFAAHQTWMDCLLADSRG